MATIDLNSLGDALTTKSHKVYTKATWGDSWAEQSALFATQSVWSSAPNMPTATLQYHYGDYLAPGSATIGAASKIANRGSFVLIEWTADDASIIYWLGYVDSIDDQPIGNGSGIQLLTCYGLDRALAVTPIASHVWQDSGGSAVRSDFVPDFNSGGKPNRTATKVGGAFLFEPVEDDAEYWSTRDIVEYLTVYQLPTDDKEAGTIPWTVDGITNLPDWDQPQVIADARTTYDLLVSLIGARRLVGWAVGFTVTTGPLAISDLTIKIYSLIDSALTLGPSVTHPANGTQHTITYNQDPLSIGTLRDNGLDLADQIIVRGARRISVCTLKRANSDLVDGWESADQTAYNTGSTAAGLANETTDEQRRLHAKLRSKPKYRDVFSLLKISDTWDNQAEDERVGGTDEPVFLDADSLQHDPAPHAVEMLQELPFHNRVDYSGDPTAVSEANGGTLRKPLVMFEHPLDSKPTDISTIGASGEENFFGIEDPFNEFTIETEVSGRQIRFRLDGAPQHAIAGAAFTPTAVDDTDYGDWDIGTTEITVALTDDRYCEVKEPSDASLSSADVVRRRVLYVGDAYRQVYIAPGTTVDIDDDGDRELSDGGYLHDDTDKLSQLAKLLAEYHTASRSDLTLNTKRRLASMELGDLITTANGTTVNAVLHQIKITAPIAYDGSEISPPVQEFVTWSGVVDPMSVIDSFRGRTR